MNTVTDIVRQIIKKSPFVQETLKNGWLNLSQYAKSIQPEVESLTYKKIQSGSIITALGRIRSEISSNFDIQFKIHDIALKLPITELNFPKAPDHSEKNEKLYEHFLNTENNFLNIISGNTETGIFVNSNYTEEVLAVFSPQKPNLQISELGAVSIKFDTKYLMTQGSVYQILKYLVWENINLFEIISTFTELTLVVKKQDTNKVVEILSKNM